MLQIYNTLTRSKVPFKPLTPGQVKMYVCGITVYDHCHIGHARTYLAFDTIIRYLKFRGYQVTYVRNITDIDDKIIERAQQNNESPAALTERFIQAMHQNFAALGLLTPDKEPKATEFMPQMIELVQQLIAKGYAYQADNGDVYYNVRKFAVYGQLSKRSLEDMQAGARVEVNTAKQYPLDFVLWKQAKPGEPVWPSPWGAGRPGWHLECSAMSMHDLGETFDIHGGGTDLIFPHHENECAQSQAATGEQFVNIWMHAGFLQINKEKMSKSLKNFFTVHDILQTLHPEILRYFTLTAHYRSALDYAPEHVETSRNGLERFYIALRGLPAAQIPTLSQDELAQSPYVQRFIAAMDDDFNTPEALAVLFDLAKEINKAKDDSAHGTTNADKSTIANQAFSLAAVLKHLGSTLGLLQVAPEQFLHDLANYSDLDVAKIDKLVQQRAAARASGNWHEADRVRAELLAQGISLEDTVSGTIWRRSK